VSGIEHVRQRVVHQLLNPKPYPLPPTPYKLATVRGIEHVRKRVVHQPALAAILKS
jgi:hypothetical protein